MNTTLLIGITSLRYRSIFKVLKRYILLKNHLKLVPIFQNN